MDDGVAPALAVRRAILPGAAAGSGAALPAWLAFVPPAGPPPPAILLLRALAAPAPRGPADASAAGRWGVAVSARLEAAAAGAARPAAGPVPLGCNAVVFADRAEMLACLARDRARGLAGERWWWRSLGRRGEAVELGAALAADLPLVPEVFARLAGVGEAMAVAAVLSGTEAAALALAVARQFGIAVPPARAGSAPAPDERAERSAAMPEPASAAAGGGLAAHRFLGASADRLQHESWADLVPEARSLAAGSPARRLLILALALARQPARATAAARAAWAEAPADGEIARHPGADAKDAPPDEPMPAGSHFPTEPVPPVPPSAPSPPPAAPAPPADDRAPLPGPAPVLVVQTRFGGLLFLLNAFLALRLYGDFTAPRAAGLPLSPWNLLALIGDVATQGRLRRDPLWLLLARLAGRPPGVSPAQRFQLPDVWAAPAEWLCGTAARGSWVLQRPRGRVRLLHPAGAPVLDVPSRRAAAMLPRFRLRQRPRRRDRPLAAAAATPAGWRDAMAAVLAARLAVALGMPAGGVLAWLATRPATLGLTGTDLTARFDLATHPLAIRSAGLDRDPGWIPAAGRDIRFRFGLLEGTPP